MVVAAPGVVAAVVACLKFEILGSNATPYSPSPSALVAKAAMAAKADLVGDSSAPMVVTLP